MQPKRRGATFVRAVSLAVSAFAFSSTVAAGEIPPELLGNAPPGSKSRAVPVYEDANGNWALFGGASSADGKNCMVAYNSQKNTLILAGPDSQDLAGIIFLSPSIPATDTQRQTMVDLHSDADPQGKPTKNVPVMVVKTGSDGMIATSIGNMPGFLKGLREAKSIWVTEGSNTLFRVDNMGGIYQARDALARCMKLPPIKTKAQKSNK